MQRLRNVSLAAAARTTWVLAALAFCGVLLAAAR